VHQADAAVLINEFIRFVSFNIKELKIVSAFVPLVNVRVGSRSW